MKTIRDIFLLFLPSRSAAPIADTLTAASIAPAQSEPIDEYEYDTITNPNLWMLETYWQMVMRSGWEVHKAVSVTPSGHAYTMTLKRKKSLRTP